VSTRIDSASLASGAQCEIFTGLAVRLRPAPPLVEGGRVRVRILFFAAWDG